MENFETEKRHYIATLESTYTMLKTLDAQFEKTEPVDRPRWALDIYGLMDEIQKNIRFAKQDEDQ